MWFGELEISCNCQIFPRRDFVGFRKANWLEFVLWSFGMKERYLKNLSKHWLPLFGDTKNHGVPKNGSISINESVIRRPGRDGKLPSQRNGLPVTRRPRKGWKMTPLDDMGWHWMTLEIYTNLTTLGSCVWNLPMKTGNAGECCDRYCRGGCGGNWGNCHRGARSYRGCCSAAWQQLAWRLERCEEYPFGIGFI